jgi:hypothetical protein
MRLTNFFKRTRLLTIISIVIFLLSSCEKEEINESYVGTWVATETVSEQGVSMTVKDIMTLTESTFTNVAQIQNPLTSAWTDLLGLKGSISVVNNIMEVVVTEIGMSTFDMITGMPTGELSYYSDGQGEFANLLAESDIIGSFQSEFSVSGDKMTIKTDANGDGDFTDSGETSVYTRQ